MSKKKEVESISPVCVNCFGMLDAGKHDASKGLKSTCALGIVASCCWEHCSHHCGEELG